MLRASEGKASEAFFVAFREQLASILRRDRESVRRIMSPWISANNLAGLEWLADLIQSEKTFIGDFEPDHWLDLKDRLYTAQETNPELGTVASRISDALQGIQRKKTGRTKQKREIEE
jgi:phosphoenolpyruvate-protein kinase (PTS system EI component)